MNRKPMYLSATALALVSAQAGAQTGPGAAPPPAATAPADHASEGLQEIVVTAQRRSENLQKVPVSVTAFSNAALEQRGLTNILELAKLTPGLELTNGGGVVAPFLRGIGNSANAIGNESSVAVYVDGVYFTRIPPGFFSLANIDHVEVLKGPQGTLFGRNSSGGVIQIITPDPSYQTTVKGHAGYGAYDTFRGDAYISTGLTDTIAMDFSISGTRQGEGFGRNSVTGTRVGYQDDFTARSKLMFQPTDKTKILLSGFYSYSKYSQQGNTYPGTTQGYLSAPFDLKPEPGFYDQDTDLDSYAKAKAWGGSLRIEQSLGFAKAVSITSWMHSREHNVYDIDYGPRPDVQADLYGGITQTTQELQLVGNSTSKLDWILGFFYYNTLSRYEPLQFQGPALIPGDVLRDGSLNAASYQSRQRAKSYALYGQATYEILPGLKLTGGLRYTMDRLKGGGYLNFIANNAIAFSTPDVSDTNRVNKLTYKAAIAYQIASDVNAYFSYSRGYKSASFTLAPFVPGATKPEVLDAYEVGIKSELLDRHLRLNAAAFWYDVKNPQVQLLNGASVTNSNAGASRVKGVELEGSAALARGLSINFGATYLDAKYRDYIGAPHGPVQLVPPYGSQTPLASIDASGNRLPLAPKFSSSLGLQYMTDSPIGKWVFTADWNHNSGFFWEPDNLLHQKAYDLANSQITYKPNGHFSFAVWVKNLTDKKYFSFATTQAGPAGYPYIAAAPRTYGVTAGFSF